MLKMSKSFVVRMVAWSGLVLYMALDFFFFNGPINQELRKMFPSPKEKMAQNIEDGICARIYNQPIYLGQVDRRVHEKLYRTGRNQKKVHANEFNLLRWAAMDELIDENLLRIKTKANSETISVSDSEIDTEVAQFEKRFSSKEELTKAMLAQGIESAKELRYRMAARLQQEKYVFSKINPNITVSEDVAKQWYNDHPEAAKLPERRKARHIFQATLNHPSAQVKATLAKHFKLLKAGQINFSSLASSISEDERSKANGGELGWMRQARLPKDFATHAFSLPLHSPALVETKLGWHILEITDIKPPETLTFESMKEEISTAISNSRRADAVKQYRHQLRLINHLHVEIFPEVLHQRATKK